jgi:hypothetical protein
MNIVTNDKLICKIVNNGFESIYATPLEYTFLLML